MTGTTAFAPHRRAKEKYMKASYGVAAALAIIAAATLPGGVASASTPIQSQAEIFDARADGAASSYCIDAPALLVGQQICGGFLRSTVTATTDPRGLALAGLAPVPKASSIPLIIPNNFQGIPVPEQVQAGLKQIKFNNIPSQCQAVFPELNAGDSDQTCGGPTYGDTALGFIGSGANARAYSTGDAENPTQTRTVGDARVTYANLTGLQSTYDTVRSLAESGLNENGMPTGNARMNAGRIAVAGGLLTIEDIVSTTTVAFAGSKATSAARTSFSYGSAALAGIPVQITPAGLVLAQEKVPAEQAAAMTKQLNEALANLNGFSVKLLPAPPIEVTDGLSRATSGGIQVSYRGSSGTDVVYTQTIGVTSAQVSAVSGSGGTSTDTPAAAAAPPAGGAPTDVTGVVATDTSTSAFPSVEDGAPAATFEDSAPAPDFGTGSAAIDGAAGADVGTIDQAGSGIQTQTLRSVGDQVLLAGFPSNAQPLSASRLEVIYPAFCLLLLAALVAARFRRTPFGKAA